MAVHLLKTPTAQLAVNGGSQHPDKRREGGHGPTLADQVEHQLLPTPRCADGLIASNMQSNRERLARGSRRRGTLEEEISLLPTPNATDGKGAGAPMGRVRPGGRVRKQGDSDLPEAVSLLASSGDLTARPSPAGKPSSVGQRPGQLSLDGLESA
jgi:hypothetical protein